MRNLFSMLLLGVLASFVLPARAQGSGPQTVPVTLSWTTYASLRNPAASPDAAPRRVPSFLGAYHGPGQVLGTYTLRLPGTIASGELREAVYEPFPAADVKLLGNVTLPAAPAVQLRYGTEARRAYSYVLLQPVRRNPQTGQAERLRSFSYAYQATAGGAASRTTATHTYAANSVLRSGDWYKIGVPRSGVYKLDQAALRSLGLPVTSLDPRRVQLYGNALGLLPQANAAPRPDDLTENNILFVGNNDAVFDANEYFLFYARGPHTWQASQPARAAALSQPGLYGLLGEGGRFKHVNNFYSDTAYYFVTVGTRNGRRIATAPTPARAATGAPITTFLDRRFYEHDLINILRSGRRWLGESFTNSTATRDFVFSGDGNPALADLVAGDTLRLTVATASTALQGSTFTVALGGATLGTQSLAGIPNGSFTTIANEDFRTFTLPTPAGLTDAKVTLSYTSFDPLGTGYLDYLELVVKRQLRLNASFLEFNSLNNKRGAGTVGTFSLANASAGAQVWEVTDARRPQAQALDASGNFVAYTDSLREFVAVQPSGSFEVPRLFGKVANQNLHALNTDGKLDLLIVTYPPFRQQAERLAQHRRTYNGMQVQVVTTKEVYNEYSSGGQDATAIRDLMKQVYDRNPDPVNRRNYLLLFGDASFDYKSSPYNEASQEPTWWASRRPFSTTNNFDAANQNFVPTYESRESFLPVQQFGGGRTNVEGESSYSSEDYYGLLDDTEGEWTESYGATFETTDIGIGRLPVRTPLGQRADASQAQQVVDKIINYDSPASFGKWRNRITFTADDTDIEKTNEFATESEKIFAANIKQSEPAYNLRKAYLDLFPQVSLAAGQRSPAAVAAIDEALEQGSLLIGYTGHGGPRFLSDEQLITVPSMLALRNQNRLTFFVTGTCDLSTYDNPELTSAGEQVLTDNPSGGAVGLFTTTRVVYSNFNTEVVNNFYTQVLARNNAGALPYLGYAASTAKNQSPSGDLNNRNYTLLADPTTRLAYPSQRVVLDSIKVDNKAAHTFASGDTLQALAQVRLSGHIERAGVLNTTFGGTADITIFDKPVTVTTLGDAGSTPIQVETQENVIYGGQASVRAGRFSVKFVVPKDIAYNVGQGKISLYAADLANKVDAQGYQPAPVGGASRLAPNDSTPPQVQLFMTDETFVSGGITGLSPLFIARLTDKSGINTSSAAIGHDITATLDNDPTKLVTINDSYTADLDNFMAGRVRYLYKDLAPGPHTIRLKAWDTYNNSAEGTIDFIAEQSAQLALDHVLNYPNPFSNITTFHFDQSRPGAELDVQVQIFTVTGRLVKTLRTTIPSSTSHVPSTIQDAALTWNGRDDYNDQLARGVYVYRVSVRTPDGQAATKFEKLVLLN
jgi:hypothetical protein